MKFIRILFPLFLALFGLHSIPMAPAQTSTVKILVLYDAPGATVDGNRIGKAYAIMLRNLLGHWNTAVDMVPVQNYTAGQIANYGSVFYIGSYYDNPIPASFLIDINSTTKNVVWFKYNIWQYAWNSAFNFNTKYGYSFSQLRGLNSPASATNPTPGFFQNVSYKGQTFSKYYAYDTTTGTVNADPDIGATSVLDSTKAQSLVTISNSSTGEQLPYVMRSGNFWYVADLPLSYIGPRDRYLVLCDLLHDMLGDTTAPSKQALVRLEDVSYLVDPTTTKQLTDYLVQLKIPFGIATIPHYKDPLGAYNGGVAQDVPLSKASSLRTALNYMISRGGRVVAHGWTHQYSNVKDPWTGVSGDDYEFWNIVSNSRVAEDSVAWALARVDSAISELGTSYKPFAFEVPHYQGSPYAYAAVRQRFPVSWGRLVYYTSDTPNLNASLADRDFAVGQIFPYVIQQDYYGNRVLPESLGNIEYNLGALDPSSNYTYTSADILLNAQMNSVVRDGVASFFFHPFWLEADLGEPGLADFKAVIQGITSMGYTWVDPSKL